MRLAQTKTLSADPNAIWPYVTEAGLINRWSLAGAQPLGPDMRRITLRLGPLRWSLTERIERSEPPTLFVYSVLPAFPVREHRGRLDLAETTSGTALTWQVDFSLALPGAEHAVARLLEHQLSISLDRLADCVATA